jgi:hypothetical protein
MDTLLELDILVMKQAKQWAHFYLLNLQPVPYELNKAETGVLQFKERGF